MAINLYVRSPDRGSVDPRFLMKPVRDQLVESTPASLKESDGLPVQEPDGTFEVRLSEDSSFNVRLVRWALEEYFGLEVVRQLQRDD